MAIGTGKRKDEDEIKELIKNNKLKYLGTASSVSEIPFGENTLEEILKKTLDQLAIEGLQKGGEYISEVRLIIYGDIYKEKSGMN